MELVSVFTHSEAIQDIAAALVKLQGIIENPKTTTENTYYQSKFADLAEVFSTVRKPMSECGLAVIQGASVRQEMNEETGALKNLIVRVETRLLHTTGQYFAFTLDLICEKNTPQGIGSCITYGRRYSLTAILGVAGEGEDDDGNAGSNLEGKPKSSAPAKPLTADGVVKTLNDFYTDPKATKEQVKAYLQARDKLLKQIPEEGQKQVRDAYDKCMSRFAVPAPSGKPTPATDEKKPEKSAAPAGNSKDGFKESLTRSNVILLKLGEAKTVEALGNIMNDEYMPDQAKLNETHRTIIEKTYEAMVEKLGGKK